VVWDKYRHAFDFIGAPNVIKENEEKIKAGHDC